MRLKYSFDGDFKPFYCLNIRIQKEIHLETKTIKEGLVDTMIKINPFNIDLKNNAFTLKPCNPIDYKDGILTVYLDTFSIL